MEHKLNQVLSAFLNTSFPSKPTFKEEYRRKLEDQKRTLRKTVTKTPNQPKVNKRDLIELIHRFKNQTTLKKDLRIFSWKIDTIFYREKYLLLSDLSEFLILLDNNWRFSYYNGLLMSLLSIWEHQETRRKIQQFLSKKIEEIQNEIQKGRKTNSRLDLQIERSNYYIENSGADRLAKKILNDSIEFDDITEYLQLQPSAFNSAYFEDVIIKYVSLLFENAKYRNVEGVKQLLSFIKHRRSRLKLLVVSQLILQITKGHFVEIKSDIKSYAFEEIGDPNFDTKWASNELSNSEQREVDLARKTLLYWINQEFIETFFELIDDGSRRSYWLKFFRKNGGLMTDFKMLLDHEYKSELRKILGGALKPYIRKKVVSFSKDCALTFKVGGYRFVEFGTYGGGTLNVHRINSPKEKKVNLALRRMSLDKDDIYYKKGEIPELVFDNQFNIEGGRLAHRGDKWKSDLDQWLRKVAKV